MKKGLFIKPYSISELIILIVATPIALSSPYGSRKLTKGLFDHLEDKLTPAEIDKLEPGKVSQALYKLRKRKIIDIYEENGITHIKLTEKGKRRREAVDICNLDIPRPKLWDGKWRMFLFDIPEDKKVAREAIREKLKQMGFFQFQKSVWIHPYDCQKEIDLITTVFNIGEYITLLVVKIDDDLPLREFFHI